MRFLPVLTVLLVFIPSTGASSLGAYAGVGESAQYRHGDCVVRGPTAMELRQNLNDSWSFDAYMLWLPIVGCNGMSVGGTSFPSALWSNNLTGSPSAGFTAAGTYHLYNPDQDYEWDLMVSPLGLETTWSIHFFTVAPGYGPYHAWWNGTTALVGAHS